MDFVGTEGEVEVTAVCKAAAVLAVQINSRYANNNVLASCCNVQVDFGAHHFGNVYLAVDDMFAFCLQQDVFGTDANQNVGPYVALLCQSCCDFSANGNLCAADFYYVAAVIDGSMFGETRDVKTNGKLFFRVICKYIN